jgi:hypothetical protein
MALTKAKALNVFRWGWKEETQGTRWARDVIAKRESWSQYTDALCKEGTITLRQYESWSNPF